MYILDGNCFVRISFCVGSGGVLVRRKEERIGVCVIKIREVFEILFWFSSFCLLRSVISFFFYKIY